MKKNQKRDNNRIIYICNYFASVCFYICAIFNFIDKNTRMGVIYLCLGSTYLCLEVRI